MLPLVFSQTVTSFSAGYLVSRTGNYKVNLLVGYAMWTIASGLLTTVEETTSNAKLIGYQLLTGIGTGQTLQITLVAIQAAVPRSAMATVTGTRNFLRMLGSALAVDCCATAINNIARFVSQVVSALPADFTRAYLENVGAEESIIQRILSDPTQIMSAALPSWEQQAALKAYRKSRGGPLNRN